MSKEIDVRGLACPAPVLQTKDAIEKEAPDSIEIIVDNEAAAASGVNTFIVWQNTPNNGLVNFYTFELNTPPTNETYAAFNKTLEANPGGKSIEFQLPTGQEILGWSFQGEATY